MSTAERRRGIELVLDRQPEIDLDELQRILARVGIVVDTDTLVEDLDALGFDVDDPTEVDDDLIEDEDDEPDEIGDDLIDDEPHDEPDELDDEPDEPHDEPDEPDRSGDEPGEGPSPRRSLIVVAGVVVVVIVVAVLLLAGGDDGDEDTTAGGDGTTETAPADDTTASTTEPVRVAPVGPGSDPALDGPETRTDDFERGGIGDFPDVATWELLSGEWANTDGNLDVTALPGDAAAVAAIEVGTGDVRAQVQIDRPASRAGIAFRIVDDRNFLVWTTVPEYTTNLLFEVVDGVATPVADSGMTATGDGMPALGINLVGTTAELLNDGVVVATYEELPPADGATRIGVAALVDDGGLPLFDEFKILAPPA